MPWHRAGDSQQRKTPPQRTDRAIDRMARARYAAGETVPPKSNILPATTKPSVGIEIDVARSFARVDFAGHISAADMKAEVDGAERRLPQLRAGFSVLVDLSGLQSMGLDCVPHLGKLMDLFKAHGVGLVVRVDPDPAKDIGFNILSITHYRGKVPVITCDTIAEAERALKR